MKCEFLKTQIAKYQSKCNGGQIWPDWFQMKGLGILIKYCHSALRNGVSISNS